MRQHIHSNGIRVLNQTRMALRPCIDSVGVNQVRRTFFHFIAIRGFCGP